MKVAIVCPYDLGKPGGVQDQAIRLRRWLADSGHASTLIGPGDEGPEDAILLGGSVSIRANRSTAPIALDPRAYRRVRSVIGSCDVVHIHEPLIPMVSLAATRIGDRPTVGTFHADASALVRRSFRISGPIARAALSRLDVTTAVSAVARSVIPGMSDVRIVPNGIDVDDYERGPKTPGSVVFLGRDDPRKGLDIMLEAWPTVRDQVPAAHLTVVGAERDMDIDGVSFLGRVPEETKRSVLAAGQVYVAPNTGGESFGIVVAEAMASGCAIVASAIPAFTRVLGDAGEFVRVGDTDALAERVVDLLRDGPRAGALGERARERSHMYDGMTVAGAYVEAYKDAIRKHGD